MKNSIYTHFFENIRKTDVSLAGGKGASLGEMTQAGIPVPPGFVVTAQAFEEFLKATDLNVELDAILDHVDHTVMHTIDDASEKIKALILGASMPEAIATEIQQSFKKLDAQYVAVRSSATSEDSADAAWAGQLESYLNTTEDKVLENVKKCWASLFTPRAIFYRFEKGLHAKPISVAVVVQKMIQSEVSGIAFSVHPVTQDYDQMIIEAGFGLGEAIVSGSITPDSFVVEKSKWNILDKNITTQERGLFRKEGGENEWKDIPTDKGEKPTLTDDEVIELAKLVVKIEKHYGFPVDVEWAQEKGTFYIVQSRPITTLAPQKENSPTFFKGHDWFLAVTRNMSFWHQVCSNQGFFNHSKDFGVNVALEAIGIVKNGTQTHIFYHQPNYGEYSQAVLDVINTKAKIEKLKQTYKIFAKELLDSLDACRKNLNIKTWQKFVECYTRMTAGLMLTATLGRSGGELLGKKLQEKGYSDLEIPAIIAAVTYPSEHTPLFQSQVDLLVIGSEIQSNKISEKKRTELLNEWLEKYQNIPVNFCDEPWNLKDAENQLNSVLKKDCKKELESQASDHKDRAKKGADFLKKINDKEIEILAHGVAEGTLLNEFRKNIFSKTSLGYRPVFQEIAEMGGSKNWRDCFYLTPDEMNHILQGKKLSISKIVKERQVVGVCIIKDSTDTILDKTTTEKLHSYIESLHGATSAEGQEKIVKGHSANHGKVEGIVKVILSSKDFHKLNPGEILVTTMTSVDFVPVMERAAAFVTNEGGITSHASIVAREMNKPCIIGTKNATQIFKDGDLVEVDADKGVVQVIQA